MRLANVVAALLLPVPGLFASAATQASINLLPLGDSITAQGFYIAPLENLLTAGGYTPNLIANEGHSGYIVNGTLPGDPAARSG